MSAVTVSFPPIRQGAGGLHHTVPGLHPREKGDSRCETGIHEGASPRHCAFRTRGLGQHLPRHRESHYAGGKFSAVTFHLISHFKLWKGTKRVFSHLFPQVVHWQSPHMHAYYPSLTSWPSMLGDMLADAINCVGFTWVRGQSTSPNPTHFST